ncbi:MAG: Gfo/Idh/MocA family oxidoreductase [Spirochaetia bacterium]|nr:Gfo/Idh/MocA family oxidoreductase [Spirochaetia bacterium]
MNNSQNIYGHLFANNQRLGHLKDSERFISARPKQELLFNVIGTGTNGQEHIRNTFFEGRAAIKGVFDTNGPSVDAARQVFAACEKHRELTVYQSLEDACSDPEIDGIIISTPNYTHIDVIRKAASYGKHMLLEKPMATTVQDAWEIVQIAKEHPGVFQIGLQYRYKSIYTEAIFEALQRKSIGDIKTISIAEHRVPFLDKVKQWNKFARYSGNTLVEKCCHYFDLFNLFAAARPVQVFASGGMDVNFTDFTYEDAPSDILDNAMVIVDYANGIRANFNLCMFSPMFYEELVLCGSGGRLKASEQKDFLHGDTLDTYLQVAGSDLKPIRTMTPKYPSVIEDLGHNGATFFEHRNFVDNILGKPVNTADVEEGFWSVVIGAAAQESIRQNMPVKIDEYLKTCGVSGC